MPNPATKDFARKLRALASKRGFGSNIMGMERTKSRDEEEIKAFAKALYEGGISPEVKKFLKLQDGFSASVLEAKIRSVVSSPGAGQALTAIVGDEDKDEFELTPKEEGGVSE